MYLPGLKKFLLWILCLAWISVANVNAQPKISDTLPVDPKLRIGKLQNGLTYYIRENNRPEKKMEMRLVVNAGSINEDDDQQGLAHMAEHMAFNGTRNFKKNELISFLQDIGVGIGSDLNAYTSFDETVYILPVPTDKKENIETGFQVLEDWAHQVTYLDEDINSERAVILEESRLGKGAEDRMFRKIYPHLFEGSKYAKRLPIGVDSIISSFSPGAIRRFYKDWYRPDLMAVVIVGDIDPSVAEQYIRKHFSGIPSPSSNRKREVFDVPPYTSAKAMVVTDKEATGYNIAVNYPAFRDSVEKTVRDYREYLVENLFISMLNQRFQELSQRENPPFIYAYGSFGNYAHGYKSFNTNAGTGTGDVKKGLNALLEEVERVRRHGFTAAELERIKKSALNNYQRNYNNRDKNESGNFAGEYVRHFLEQEPIPGIEKEYEYAKAFIPGISLEEVNQVANRFRNDKNRFIYVFGPENQESEKLPTEKEILAMAGSIDQSNVNPYEEKAVSEELLTESPVPGKIISQEKDTVLGLTELKLSNGVTVTLKPTTFKDDQVLMGATRQGGKNNYDLADKYNAEYATAIVNAMGVGAFTPTDLRKALAGKSVSVSPVFSTISDGLRGSSGARDIESMMQLAYLYFTSPRRDTGLFRSFVQKNKSQYANLDADPQTSFIDTMYKVLFHGDPLAPVVVPKPEYFEKINLDRSLEIYRERFGNATGMHFVFVGSFSPEEIMPLVEKYIASLPSSPKKFFIRDNKVRPVKGAHELKIFKGAEEQSMILGFYTGEIPYSQGLDLKMKALSEILNIRIFEELREKVQGIYGGQTFSSVERYPYSNFNMVVQLPTGPEKADTLISLLNREFQQMITKGPDEKYLDKVKKQWLEHYRTNLKENNVWLNQILDARLKGTGLKYFSGYETYVKSLKPSDVQEAARIALGGKNKFIAILHPEKYKPKEVEKKKAF